MTRTLMKLSLTTLCASFCMLTQAADVNGYAETSSLGLGVGVLVSASEAFDLRLGYNTFSYSKDYNDGDIKYSGDIKLSNFSLIGEYHPMNGLFHVDAGVMFGNNKVNVKARPAVAGTYTINGVAYPVTAGDGIDGQIKLSDGPAPYLGMGWGNAAAKASGWGFRGNIGFMFGKVKTTLTPVGQLATAPNIQTNITAEENKLNDDARLFKAYPVLSFGVSYKF